MKFEFDKEEIDLIEKTQFQLDIEKAIKSGPR